MSSSDRTVLKRSVRIAAGLALAVLLAGCQVRPLHSTGSAVGSELASVSVSESRDRVEQQVRNHLVFLLAGGAGEPASATYQLDLNVASRTVGALLNIRTDMARAGRVVVSADYNLARIDTGETVASGKRSTLSPVDFPVQEFAKLRAIRDAENRAARELAEIIRADIAAALARR